VTPPPASKAAGPATRRPKDRKASIVDAAAELFAQRGYAAVGIDDIGAAVGVTGPAIYRHYRGKEALLAAVIDRTTGEMLVATEAAAAEGTGLAAVVRASVEVALAHPALVRAYARERGRAEGEAAVLLRQRERRMGEIWRDVILGAQPGLDHDRVRMRQQAVIGALGAAARPQRGVEEPRLTELLTASSLAVGAADPRPDVAVVADGGWTPAATRRDTILHAALTLFEDRGFQGVGIDEIGEASGISGPGIYRYYASKAELLVDAYDQAGERVLVGVDDAIRQARSASDALARLAASYAEVALDSAALITVTEREGGFVPDDHRGRLTRRGRDIRDGWAAVVRELRPELTEAEVRTLVRMVFPVVNQAARWIRGRRDLTAELAGLAEAFVSGGAEK
jgi:AcrR family transcriptional regulator